MSTQTRPENVITLIIPGTNFTCISNIIVVGRNLSRHSDAKNQIWRENTSQPLVFHKVGEDIAVNTKHNGEVCVCTRWIVGNAFWCILAKSLQTAVQPGDILGLELPNISNSEILFTANRGPVNYVFQH